MVGRVSGAGAAIRPRTLHRLRRRERPTCGGRRAGRWSVMAIRLRRSGGVIRCLRVRSAGGTLSRRLGRALHRRAGAGTHRRLRGCGRLGLFPSRARLELRHHTECPLCGRLRRHGLGLSLTELRLAERMRPTGAASRTASRFRHIMPEKIPVGCVCGRSCKPFATACADHLSGDAASASASYETGVTVGRRLLPASASSALVFERSGLRQPFATRGRERVAIDEAHARRGLGRRDRCRRRQRQ